MIHKILGRLGLLWGAFWFLLSWLWVWPAYQIVKLTSKGDERYKKAFAVSKLWGHFMLFGLGVRVKQFGQENKCAGEQVVYVCNHRSQIDIPLNFTTTPQFVILSKLQAAKIPVVGTNLRLAHVTVDRKSSKSRKESIERLREHLRAGRSILLYPEGRRSRDENKLGKFHDGAFHLAIEFHLPVVPITFVGSDKINNPNDPFALYPGKVQAYYDKAISTKGMTSADIDSLKEQTKTAMLHHL